MITENQKKEIRQFRQKYSELHERFTSLANDASRIEMQRAVLSQELDNTRKLERELINNIEQQIGRKLEQSFLLEIMQENE